MERKTVRPEKDRKPIWYLAILPSGRTVELTMYGDRCRHRSQPVRPDSAPPRCSEARSHERGPAHRSRVRAAFARGFGLRRALVQSSGSRRSPWSNDRRPMLVHVQPSRGLHGNELVTIAETLEPSATASPRPEWRVTFASCFKGLSASCSSSTTSRKPWRGISRFLPERWIARACPPLSSTTSRSDFILPSRRHPMVSAGPFPTRALTRSMPWPRGLSMGAPSSTGDRSKSRTVGGSVRSGIRLGMT